MALNTKFNAKNGISVGIPSVSLIDNVGNAIFPTVSARQYLGLQPSLSGLAALVGGNSLGSALTIGTNDNYSLNLETGGSTRMTVTSAGNVGIGTTAPTTPLTIVADGAGSGFNVLGSSGNFIFQSGGVNGAGLISQSNISTAGFLIGTDGGSSTSGSMLRFQTQGTVRAVIDNTGNVGIGTASPSAKLQIGSHSGIVPTNTVVAIVAANPRLSFSSDDANINFGGYIQSSYSGGTFMTLGTRYESVDTIGLTIKAGAVGIGTTTPSTKLEIVTTGASIDGIKLKRADDDRTAWLVDEGTGSGALYLFNGSNSNTVFITGNGNSYISSGNLGLGTSSSTAKLDILDTTLAGSGALSGSALSIAQTWNTTGNPTAIKLNVTNTSSGAASNLLDLQVGGVSKLYVDKSGMAIVPDSATSGGFVFRPGNSGSGGIGYLNGGGYGVWAGAGAAIGFSTGAALNGNILTALYTDGANTLAQRNSTAPQELRVYRSYTDASNYERFYIRTNTGTTSATQIGLSAAGTGQNRDLEIVTGGSTRMTVTSAGFVGIGATAPSSILDINDSSGSQKSVVLSLRNGSFGWWTMTSSNSNTSGFLRFASNNSGQTPLTLDGATGSVGISNNAPVARLDIADTALAGSGSLAGSILNLAQTWNTTGAPTAIKLNVTNTASGAASNLLDLQVDTTSKFKVGKGASGSANMSLGSSGGDCTFSTSGNLLTVGLGSHDVQLCGSLQVMRSNLQAATFFLGHNDTSTSLAPALLKDANYVLAQRNGVNPQTFRLYNTYTDATTFERLNIKWDSNILRFQTEKGSVGGTTRSIQFFMDGLSRMTISPTSIVSIADETGTQQRVLNNYACLNNSYSASTSPASTPWLLDAATNDILHGYNTRLTVTNTGTAAASGVFTQTIEWPLSELTDVNGMVYAEGTAILRCYYQQNAQSVRFRLWNNSASAWGSWYTATNITGDSEWGVWRASLGGNYLTKFEWETTSPPGNSTNVMSVEYYPTRANSGIRFPHKFAAQGASRLLIGGGTSGYCSIVGSGNILKIRNGNDSADGSITAAAATFSTTLSVAGISNFSTAQLNSINLVRGDGSVMGGALTTSTVGGDFVALGNSGNSNGTNIYGNSTNGIGVYVGSSVDLLKPTALGRLNGTTSNTDLSIYNTSSGQTKIGIKLGNSSTSSGSNIAINFVDYTDAAYGQIRGVYNGAVQTGQLAFLTANGGALAETLRITNTGNVGIGTITPNEKLTVVGAISSSNVVYASGGNSSLWNSAYTSVNTISANGATTYTTVNSNSANWSSVYSTTNANSANWSSVYTLTNSNSANWSSVYTTTNTNSAGWASAYTTTNTNSAKWNSDYTTVNTNSANWSSVYTTTNTNSANWNSTYTTTNANSAKWDSTYSTVNTNSANYILDGGNTKGANLLVGTNDNFNLGLETAGTTKMTVTSAGNVGIGTTGPNAKLEVVESTSNIASVILRATTAASPRVEFIDGAGTPNRWSVGAGAGTTSDGKFFIYDARQNAHRLNIDASGNVGIGTITPDAKLHIVSLSAYTGTMQSWVASANSSYNLKLNMLNPGAVTYSFDLTNAGTLYSNNLVLDRGNVGIGTAAPNNKLDVIGNAFIGDSTTAGTALAVSTGNGSVNKGGLSIVNSPAVSYTALSLQTNWSDGAGGDIVKIFNATGTKFLINNNGNVGIGTTAPNEKLTVAGNISSSNIVYALGGNSNLWNSAYTSVNTISANGASTFTTVNANSANWSSVYSTTNANSANWSSSYATATAVSAIGASTYSTVNANSANWNSTYTTVNTNSANYILAGGNSKGADIVIGTNDNFALNFETNGTTKMSVTNTGTVGIGVTSPRARIHVNGGDDNSVFSNATIALGYSSTGDYPHFIHTRHNNGTAAVNAIDFYTSNGTAAGVFPTHAVHGLTINGGAVGVGTTSPNEKLSVSGNISSSRVIYASGGNSDLWNSAYTSVNTISANGATTYTTVNTNSANWSSVYSTTNANSANWSSVYTTTNANSSSWSSVYTTTNTNSANWNSSYTLVNSNNTNWTSVYTTTNTNSANWNSAYTTVNTGSPNWNSVYTTTNANSAKWESTYTSVNNISANGASTHTTVNANSAAWSSVYTTVNTNSANYILDGGNTKGVALIVGTNDNFALNFETAGTTKMTVTSAGNIGIGTTTPTSKLDIVDTTSAINLSGAALNISHTWNAPGVDVTAIKLNINSSASGANSKLIDLQIGGTSYFNVDKAGATTMASAVFVNGGNSNLWNSNYTTTNTNSANWNNTYTATSTNSDRWSSVYTTVNTNSASYIVNGGNTLGSAITIGTNDANNFNLETGGTARISMLATGNVGIGTTTPDVDLVVYKNVIGTPATLKIRTATGTGSRLDFYRTDAYVATRFDVLSTNEFQFYNNNDVATPKYIINGTNGNFGIGTTSTAQKVTIGGSLSASGSLYGERAILGDTAASVYLERDAINALGIRNSTAAQTLNVYGTYTSGTNFERLTLAASSLGGVIGHYAGGGGVARDLLFQTSGTTRMTIAAAGSVNVAGHFSAATKSFLIDHPTQEGKKLQYGVVESNQHSVLVRGKTSESIIELPEEWSGLVHEDSVTVQLTPIGSYQQLYVVSQDNQRVVVGGSTGKYNYTIYGERKDVDKLQTVV